MGKVLVDESSLQNIANAIRTKSGVNDTYVPSQMGEAISNIPIKNSIANGKNNINALQIGNAKIALSNSDYYFCRLLDSNGDYINIQLSSLQTLKYRTKFRVSSFGTSSYYPMMIQAYSQNASIPQIWVTSGGKVRAELTDGGTTGIETSNSISLNTWYFVELTWENKTLTLTLYNSNNELIQSVNRVYTNVSTATQNICIGGSSTASFKFRYGEIDLAETYIEKDGAKIWSIN